jgi:ATP-dependent DNA ligase
MTERVGFLANLPVRAIFDGELVALDQDGKPDFPPQWRTPEAFDDGEALWSAVCEYELEGVVAKRRSGRYVPGRPGWIKTKNRDYWRYEMEREGAFKAKRPRQFV